MVISFSDFPRRCNEIAGKSEQPTADVVITFAKYDALKSFKSHVKYATDKVHMA